MEFSLRQRRRYDQIHVEIWAKAIAPSVPKIGNASLIINYDANFLTPDNNQNPAVTDSINYVIDKANPIDVINSPYNQVANGYSALQAHSYGIGYYSLEISLNNLFQGGYAPDSTGKGTYVGTLIFDITGDPSENTLTGVQWCRSAFPNIVVTDINGNTINQNINFIDPGAFNVVGITMLSPVAQNLIIDRDMNYSCLSGDYKNSGYPVYFERSINPNQYTPPTNQAPDPDENLAYSLQYSLDDGNSFINIGRVTETDKPASILQNNLAYITGEIFNPATVYSNTITTQDGSRIGLQNFRKPLRVIWAKNSCFNDRSEMSRLKITKLGGSFGSDLNSRPLDVYNYVSPFRLILGRIFFMQLNGNSQYLKTTGNYSNATQLTVEAWVDLNEYKSRGSEPAIVASSGGPDAIPINGSKEGAWMLYLQDGKYPAFRVREQQNRGVDGYLAKITSYYSDSLTLVPESELSDRQSKNWVHVAATVSDNVVSLYINGELVDRVVNDSIPNIRMLTTQHPIWVGVNPNNSITTNSFLHASVKEVKVWRIALSQDEIRRYASGVPNPSDVSVYGDLRRGLELYYSLEGQTNDLASDINYQNNSDNAVFYDINNQNNKIPKYLPDKPHIKLTAPATGAGISNIKGKTANVRWVSFGVGDTKTLFTNDVCLEYSIDGGQTWWLARDSTGAEYTGNKSPDAEASSVLWEPYENTNISANLRTITPYTKPALFRIHGTVANCQDNIIDESGPYSIAPYFAIQKNEAGQVLVIPADDGMNITGSNAFMEAWIRPYRFPTLDEGFFPIITKIDSSSGVLHYALNLLPTGQLQLQVADNLGNVRLANSDINQPIKAPNSTSLDSAWTHVGVYVFLNNGIGQTEVRFYIDGTPQRNDTIMDQLGSGLKVNATNLFPTYIGYNPFINKGQNFNKQTESVEIHGNIYSGLQPGTTVPMTFNVYDDMPVVQGSRTNTHSLDISLLKLNTPCGCSFEYTPTLDGNTIPNQTELITINGFLDSASTVIGTKIDTTIQIYDNRRVNPHDLLIRFTKTTDSTWTFEALLDGTHLNNYNTIYFNKDGSLKYPNTLTLYASDLNTYAGTSTFDQVTPRNITVVFAMTQSKSLANQTDSVIVAGNINPGILVGDTIKTNISIYDKLGASHNFGLGFLITNSATSSKYYYYPTIDGVYIPRQTQIVNVFGRLDTQGGAGATQSDSIHIYDNKNPVSHVLNANFSRTAVANQWNVIFSIDGNAVNAASPFIITFDANGKISGTSSLTLSAGLLNSTLVPPTQVFNRDINVVLDSLAQVTTTNPSPITLYSAIIPEVPQYIYFNTDGTLKQPYSFSIMSRDVNTALNTISFDTTKSIGIKLGDPLSPMTGLTNFTSQTNVACIWQNGFPSQQLSSRIIASISPKRYRDTLYFNEYGNIVKPVSFTLKAIDLNAALDPVTMKDNFDSKTPKNINVKFYDQNGDTLTYKPTLTTAPIVRLDFATGNFYGEIREVRFWNGLPGNASPAGLEPTPLTLFIQGSLCIRSDSLQQNNKTNLFSMYSFNGGSFVMNGYARTPALSNLSTQSLVRFYGKNIKFVPVQPYVKLVEPYFQQSVPNSKQDVRVRWAGFDYDGTGYSGGTTSLSPRVPPSIEYSILGGGGDIIQPYQYVGSKYWLPSQVNAVSLPDSNFYKFNGGGINTFYALKLDASVSDPDVNNDGIFNDQGPLSASLNNARLKLTSTYTLNGETNTIKSESPLFTVTPNSNFTVRLLLEGYHNGEYDNRLLNNIGTTYATGGIHITLYKDNSGGLGDSVCSSDSYFGYDDRNPYNRGKMNNRFANINFVFTNIADGNYWVIIDQINHLPVMSRFAAPFKYAGDDIKTWRIESGWDFQSWNGLDYNVLPSAASDPWLNRNYTASGDAVKLKTDPLYATTGLNYNDGVAGTILRPMASMVGGDVVKDGVINANDRVKVRQDDGTGLISSDVTGDGVVNADDRSITDRNNGKISAVYQMIHPLNAINDNNPLPLITHEDVGLTMTESDKELYDYFKNNEKFVTHKYVNKTDATLAGISYEVNAEINAGNGVVDVDMYIKNTGDKFSPANCTFALDYSTSSLQFQSMLKKTNVLFSSNSSKGYAELRTAPRDNATNPLPNLRTIEIDYDAYSNPGGINVPTDKTYLGTLRYIIIDPNGVAQFSWDPATSVHTTDEQIITSKGIFNKISPVILYSATILTPNRGMTVTAGKPYSITWKTDATTNSIIELSTDGGTSWEKVCPDKISLKQKTYSWSVPVVTSAACKIRIIDAATGIEVTRSDSTFTILQSFVQLLRPSSGDPVYTGGTADSIKWISQLYTGFRIDFSSDAGGKWSTVITKATASTQKSNWTLPKVTTKNAMIRFVNLDDDSVIVTSGRFRILSGNVKFRKPLAGSKLLVNKPTRIQWSVAGVDNFDLQITTDAGNHWQDIKAPVPASPAYYDWTVSNTETTDAYLRAIWLGDEEMEFDRVGPFTIYSLTGIEEILPSGYIVGEAYPNPTIDNAVIDFSIPTDNQVTISLIDLNGVEIRKISSMKYETGDHTVTLKVSDLPSGTYYILFNSKKFRVVRELVVVR